MFYRVTALAVAAFWAAMMSWLLYHDVWPAWSAQEPPRAASGEATWGEGTESQVGIFDDRGNRIGTAWTSSTMLGTVVNREDLVFVYRFPGLPPTRIGVDSTFGAEGILEDIKVHVDGHGIPIVLEGERFAGQFAFRLTAGLRDLKFKIPEAHAGMMGQMFRPFTRLGDLRVGQSWRMQVFNPFAAVSGFGSPFMPMLVQVTGKETLMRGRTALDCFVVEAAGSRAVVGPDGTVYEHQVQLPVGGTIHIRDEPFSDDSRSEAKSMSLLPAED